MEGGGGRERKRESRMQHLDSDYESMTTLGGIEYRERGRKIKIKIKIKIKCRGC